MMMMQILILHGNIVNPMYYPRKFNNLDKEFYEKSGGVLAESEHYQELFQDKH